MTIEDRALVAAMAATLSSRTLSILATGKFADDRERSLTRGRFVKEAVAYAQNILDTIDKVNS